MAEAATGKRYTVQEFKGMFAVMEGERLVTRTATEERAMELAAEWEKAPPGRRPFSSKVAPVEEPEPAGGRR